MKKKFFLILKLSLAGVALWYVFQRIDVVRFWEYVHSMSPIYVVASFVALTLGQATSALRMRYYMGSEGLHLTRYYAIALYWVGALFNLVLPGGIGGDGYKILLLSRLKSFSALLAFRRVVSGRASGLLVLIVLALFMGYFSQLSSLVPYSFVYLTIGLVGIVPCYLFCIKWLLKESAQQAVGAARYSFVVQVLCVVTAYFLFVAMGMESAFSIRMVDYLVLFLISSIVSVLPISIGGVGLREITFYYGALLFGLDMELGVAFSLVYFAINTIISLAGVFFWLRLPVITAIEYSDGN